MGVRGRSSNSVEPQATSGQIIRERKDLGKPSVSSDIATKSKRKDVAPIKASSKRHCVSHHESNNASSKTARRSLHQHVQPHRHAPSVTLHPRHDKYIPLRHLSRLETLPTEILEQIFLHILTLSIRGSPVLSFPRSSFSIGRKLSSEYVRREVFLRVCSDQRPTRCNPNRPVMPMTDDDKHVVKTQSWILRQPWLNLEFIRGCIPGYMASVLRRGMSEKGLRWLSDTAPFVNASLEPTIRNHITHQLEQHAASPGPPSTSHIHHLWVEPEHPSRTIMLALHPPTGAINLQFYKTEGGYDIGDVYDAHWCIMSLTLPTEIPSRLLNEPWTVQIPSHLLHGPWTLPRIEHLELLIRGGATVDWVHTTAGEVAERGFQDALREQNARALRALCIADNPLKTPFIERKHLIYQNRFVSGVGIIPRQEHLLMAIKHGCQTDVVEVMLNAPVSQCDLQAIDIKHAIYQMECKGWLERATWLTEKRNEDMARRLQQSRSQRARN